MLKLLITLFLVLTAAVAGAQTELEGQVQLFAGKAYRSITNMSRVRIGICDAREGKNKSVVDLFRRYDDAARLVHPSVLESAGKYTHFFVVASRLNEVEAMAETLKALNVSAVQCVLLFAGEIPAATKIEPVFDAVFYLPNTSDAAVDVLVQAAFNGIAVTRTDAIHFISSGLWTLTTAKTRLSFGDAKSVGMSEAKLSEIDVVMRKMMQDKASPGGYVLVARRGKVVYSKAFGQTQYSGGQAVTNYSMYDIASLSKIIGTLPIVMRLFDDGDIDASTELGLFLPNLSDEKRQITVEQLLMHRSGLPATVPAFMLCADSSTIISPIYSSRRKAGYSVQIEPQLYIRDGIRLRQDQFSTEGSDVFEYVVARDLFTTRTMRDHLLSAIDSVPLLKPTTRYSDLNFIYLQRISEIAHHRELDEIFLSDIARPLGIKRLTYCPLNSFPESVIVPTENDRYFRRQQLQGTVHDQLAALLGGVAGNAGLFGTALEVAKIAQMYLNGGTYGGVRLIAQSTVAQFVSRHLEDSRRGYGFDKPELRPQQKSPVTEEASAESYGHSGFSGTLVWVDPAEELVFVFLSNRIYPNAYNSKLTQTNVRSEVHKKVYKAIVE